MCFGGTDCGGGDSGVGSWKTIPCDTSLNYICEVPCIKMLYLYLYLSIYIYINVSSSDTKYFIRYQTLVHCGEGWSSWDNSCYQLGTSINTMLSVDAGIDFCAEQYDAEVFVPNSKDEAEFIGRYLQGKKVRHFR